MTSATARMPSTVWMQATAVTHLTTVSPAASNNKDDSNILTSHSRRNTGNRRKECNNRSRQHYAGRSNRAGPLNSAAGTIGTSWMSTASEPSEKTVGKSATVEKTETFSRDISCSSRNIQLEHSATAAETIGTSQTSTVRETSNSKDARNSRD
jgi:hypothetical protein